MHRHDDTAATLESPPVEEQSHARPVRLLDIALHAWQWNGLYFLTGGLSVATTLLLPSALAAAINALLRQDGAQSVASTRVRDVVILLTLNVLATAFASLAKNSSVACSSRWLRRAMVGRIAAAGPQAQERYPAGDLAVRVGDDAAVAAETAYVVMNTAFDFLTAAGAILALGFLDWRLVLVFVVVIPTMSLVARRSSQAGRQVFREYREDMGRTAGFLTESLLGARTVRASGTQRQERERILSPLPDLLRAGQAGWRVAARSVWWTACLSAVGVLAILATAVVDVHQGNLHAGDVLAVAGYATLATGFSSQVTSLSPSRAAVARVAEVLELRPLRDVQTVVSPARTPRSAGGAVAGKAPTVVVDELVVMRNDQKVLDGVSFVIPAGTSLAVVGSPDSGASFLVQAVSGLRRIQSGSVRIDGSPPSPGSVSVAFARPFLLGATIGETLTYGVPEAEHADVVRAARTADIDRLIARLPEGYESPTKDLTLSGGELQRLGIARAILHGAPFIVFEDATSSLDSATEERVATSMERSLRHRTRLFISNRPRLAGGADAVLWLSDGKVMEIDTHERLMRFPAYQQILSQEPGTGVPGGVRAGDRR
ncbi:ABC transporter ATP-binding protein [Streptosporangium sp. NPDC051022]|uniref:ABC transporter ATP-binding protein n=1 Tax=Streptosporangium sp. NPDC051022 TaxID=3155752 RepID=UPI003438847E